MSDEEKKAIETLKSDLTFCKSLRKRYRDEQQEKDYETVLNLIEKQSKEIEELKENNELLQENYSSAHKDINWFCENYISKDKIKAKIEEISKEWAEGELDGEWYEFMKYHLESLLEKE